MLRDCITPAFASTIHEPHVPAVVVRHSAHRAAWTGGRPSFRRTNLSLCMTVAGGYRTRVSTKDLAGKSVIITGASRGIGRAIALEAAARGANVAFNYLKSEQRAHEVCDQIEALGIRALAFKVDVSDLKAVREMVNAVKKDLGAIDGLVNNAGLTR